MFILRFIGNFIKFIIKTVLITAMILIILTVSGYVWVREQFNFDPYDTVKYSCALGEMVDVTTLTPNAFSFSSAGKPPPTPARKLI